MEPEGWIARDKNGMLCFYSVKPKKGDSAWCPLMSNCVVLWRGLFPEVRWEDEEPTKVRLVKIENEEVTASE